MLFSVVFLTRLSQDFQGLALGMYEDTWSVVGPVVEGKCTLYALLWTRLVQRA